MNRLQGLGTIAAIIWLTCGQARAQSDSQAPPPPDETRLEDIVVTGTRHEAQAQAFVASVGAPALGRKLATWSGEICVGAAGLAPEIARVMVDRVLDWGHSLSLRVGSPGCRPNILIVFSEDGDRMAQELVRTRPLDFDAGVSGSHRGRRDLREFQHSGRPVRWWHVSLPVDPDTGEAIVRLRGQTPFSAPADMTRPGDFGSIGRITTGSRLSEESVDALQSIIVVIDATALERTSFAQLSEYVAMIALAQVDPDAKPTVPSILRIFEDDAVHEQTLSSWDQAFLHAIYSTRYRSEDPRVHGSQIARSVALRLEELSARANGR